jgi:hypothetical protein
MRVVLAMVVVGKVGRGGRRGGGAVEAGRAPRLLTASHHFPLKGRSRSCHGRKRNHQQFVFFKKKKRLTNNDGMQAISEFFFIIFHFRVKTMTRISVTFVTYYSA